MAGVYHVYILTNAHHTVLYTGVTSDLVVRVSQHREKLVPGFTQQYNVSKLVWCEEWGDIWEAIAREKQIKSGSRKKKVALIDAQNPEWADLFPRLVED
jgi:putative endonuclease